MPNRKLIIPLGIATLCAVGFAAAQSVAKPAGGDGGPAQATQKGKEKAKDRTKKATAAEREAEAFLNTVTPLLTPVGAAASEADWVAATDVTPEHTGQRAGADKVLATLSGSPLII